MKQLKLIFDDNLESFDRFIEKAKIHIPGTGVTHFKLFDFQKRLVEYCESYDYVIGSKFRQGGFDMTLLFYGLWKALHGENDVVIVCPFLRMVCDLHDRMEAIIDYLPEEFQSCIGKSIDLSFKLSNGNSISFYHRTDECYGLSPNSTIILIEAAYCKNLDLAPFYGAGKIIIISSLTPNETDFEKLLKRAIRGLNMYKVYTCHYTEFPLFQNQEYMDELKLNMGRKFWEREIEQKLTKNH